MDWPRGCFVKLYIAENSLLERFKAVQDRTIAIVAGTTDEEAHEQCRDEFENRYYRLTGAIRRRIQSSQASSSSPGIDGGSAPPILELDAFFLRTLDLRNSTINRIDSNTVLPLYNLHTLEPSKIRHYKLAAQLFNGPFVLNRLTLSGNAIAFRDCSNLNELYLSENEQIRVLDAPHRESKQPLPQLVPQPRPADWVQIQDNLLANTHVVIHGRMNSRREPLLPDIDDARHHQANDSNIIKLTIISLEGRGHNDADGFLAANYGKQQQQDDCITSDNEILGSSHSIEILQTQYLLKTTYENYVTAETVHGSQTRCRTLH
ncbi:hypothetical protein K0M31_012649 [Melipona bicolor]|uniref:Uncharacterized protein n=1 Tax=Melipona bicolor TaxID=60889 RepID=A0AA40KHA8_9HYME|nr:hypothetical protein K0M31_012649 [Melipona bicolor]